MDELKLQNPDTREVFEVRAGLQCCSYGSKAKVQVVSVNEKKAFINIQDTEQQLEFLRTRRIDWDEFEQAYYPVKYAF